MVNRRFSWIFSSTARSKSSLGGQPLCGSSCTFSCPSLKCLTHLLTIELLMACSLYTSQSWRWISVGFMFLAFKKRITDRISHAAGFSIFLKLCTHAHHSDSSDAAAMFASGTYFLDTPRIYFIISSSFTARIHPLALESHLMFCYCSFVGLGIARDLVFSKWHYKFHGLFLSL
jgi:hypothetical protein